MEFFHNLQKRSLVWDTITTTWWSSLGRAIGLLIPFFIAAWFGVTSETDAFFFAYGLILFLSGIFAPVVENIIVPYIAEAKTKNEDVGRFVGKILGVTGGGLFAFAGIFLLIMKPILSLMTDFDLESLNLVYHLTIEIAPLIILLTWTSILAGTLNAHKRFALPALSPAFRAIANLIIIFFLKDKFGVHSVALGYIGGEIVRLVILVIVIKKLNLFRLRLSFQIDNRLRDFINTASYQTIGMAAVGLNPIIDKTMASWLDAGSVSILHYADRLYMIPITFMSTGLMVTILSHWSSRYYESGIQRLKADVKKTIKVVAPATLAIALVLISLHQPIVKFFFGRGEFNQTKLPEVGWVWVCYLLGVLPYTIGKIFVQAHLTLKNTRALMQNAFYLVILKITLNFILMKPLRVAGLALATSLTSLFTILYLGILFYIESKSKESTL